MAIEKKAKETAPAPSDKQKALETAISKSSLAKGL